MEVVAESLLDASARAQEARKEDAAVALAELVDELAHGVLIVGPSARVIHANQAAQRELANGASLTLVRRVLRTARAEDAAVLHDCIARAADGKRSLVRLPAGPGVTLSVAALPLGPDRATGEARVGLVLARVSVCEPLMLFFFARNHALTAAEENVLGLLCQGYSAPETAVQLKVAVSTVRTHVRSLCAKTRTGGIRELVNLVAVLPPLAVSSGEPVH